MTYFAKRLESANNKNYSNHQISFVQSGLIASPKLYLYLCNAVFIKRTQRHRDTEKLRQLNIIEGEASLCLLSLCVRFLEDVAKMETLFRRSFFENKVVTGG